MEIEIFIIALMCWTALSSKCINIIMLVVGHFQYIYLSKLTWWENLLYIIINCVMLRK